MLSFTAPLLFASCGDFLEIKSTSEIVLEDFWNEKADVDNIVAGCYSRMQSDDVIRRMIVWGEARAENVTTGSNIDKDQNLENVLRENITTKNAYTTWDGFYAVINRCNTVIKYAPGVAERDPGYTQSELQATIAEVSGLRDLCYFYLIRTFRNVPFSFTAYTDDDQIMDLAPTSFENVLDSLINDLEKVKGQAIRRYPTTKPMYQTGRITQDAIYAMLCEMYLWKQDYQNCIKYADLVIQSKKDLQKEQRTISIGISQSADEARLNGFPLVTDAITSSTYGNAYKDVFVDGNSLETIFELVFDNQEAGRSMPNNSAVSVLYGNANTTKGFLGASDAVVSDIGKSSQRTIYADRNKKLDARMYECLDPEASTITKYVYGTIRVNASSKDPVTTYSSKFSDGFNSCNWIIYRLSDIMLLKAEALCQLMSEGSEKEIIDANAPLLAQAFTLVNAVNKRSLCQYPLVDTLLASAYSTKDQMQTLVLQERQRELMFEGKRWYDLVRQCMRTNTTDAVTQAAGRREAVNGQYVQNFFGSQATGMYAIFWPYNEEETKVNLNLAAAQNPAFSSGEGNISK